MNTFYFHSHFHSLQLALRHVFGLREGGGRWRRALLVSPQRHSGDSPRRAGPADFVEAARLADATPRPDTLEK